MTYLVYDLVIGVILLFFALHGRKRGLVLALCSLIAVITSFAGATYLADALTPKAADIAVPKIASIIERRLADMNLIGLDPPGDWDAAAAYGKGTAGDLNNVSANQAAALMKGNDAASSETVQKALEMLHLPDGMLNSVSAAMDGMEYIGRFPSVLSAAIARTTAETILHLLIFLVSFILILLLWRIIAHALDLVARIPVLHFFNKTGGFLLGLSKGVLFLFVLAWVLRYLGNVIPDDAVSHTYLLHFFMTNSPLLLLEGI